MATPQELEAILEGPALQAPPGQTYNLIDPPNKNFWFIVTLTITVTISTFAVLIRVYTKFFVVKLRGLEDCELLLGYKSKLKTNKCLKIRVSLGG